MWLLISAPRIARLMQTSLNLTCCADVVQPGIQFQDVTTILLDPVAFKHTIDLLAERYRDQEVDVIAGELHVFAGELHMQAVTAGHQACGCDWRLVLSGAAQSWWTSVLCSQYDSNNVYALGCI